MKRTKLGDFEENIPIPTFLYDICVVFTDADDLHKSVDSRTVVFKNSMSGAEQGARALHVTAMGKSFLFFRLGKNKAGEEWAAPDIIAHESYHAVNAMLMKWAGVRTMDEEVVAYHLSYIVKHVLSIKLKVEEAIKNEPIHAAQGKSTGVQGMQSTTTTGKREAH
jgi:hypothetical protein